VQTKPFIQLRTGLPCVLLLFLLSGASNSVGQLTFTWQPPPIGFGRYGTNPPPTTPDAVGISLVSALDGPGGPAPATGGLFDNFALTPDDVGHLFVVTPSDDPDFASIAGYLTNGADDWLGIRRGPFGQYPFAAVYVNEAPVFAGQTPNGIDLQGLTVTSISMRLDALTILTIPPAGGQPPGYRVDGNATFFFTAVPEPSSTVLLVLALGCIVPRLRRGSRGRNG